MTIIYLADVTNDNTLISVEQMLRTCADEVQSGKVKVTKALVILLNDSNDEYNVYFRASNIKLSEMVSICTVHIAKCTEWLLGRSG